MDTIMIWGICMDMSTQLLHMREKLRVWQNMFIVTRKSTAMSIRIVMKRSTDMGIRIAMKRSTAMSMFTVMNTPIAMKSIPTIITSTAA